MMQDSGTTSFTLANDCKGRKEELRKKGCVKRPKLSLENNHESQHFSYPSRISGTVGLVGLICDIRKYCICECLDAISIYVRRTPRRSEPYMYNYYISN